MLGDYYKSIFESGSDAELVLDGSGVVVNVSDGYLVEAGLSREQVLGHLMRDLPPYRGQERAQAELGAVLGQVRDMALRLSNSVEDTRAELPGQRWKRGLTLPVLGHDGRVAFVVHTLKEEEAPTPELTQKARLQKLVEYSSDTMALFDFHSRATFVSPSVKRLLGYTETEFIENAIEIVHPDDRRVFGERIRALHSRPGGVLVQRFRVRHKDGSWRTLELSQRNLLDDPDVGAIVSNFHDVTPYVEFANELERVNRELRELSLERGRLLDREQRANRTKDDFLAMLGHELRNPLSPIVTALALMRERDERENRERREMVIIERQVGHLVQLVDDLLDVARIARGKVHLKRQPLELEGVVGKAIEMTSPLFEQKQHRLICQVPAAGLRVFGDERRLAQIVANLLDNAAKYTPAGGVVEITAERQEDFAALTVRDNGRGLKPDLLPRLFEQFVQGERSRDRAEGGLGLGLAIVQSLVELHGGTITAESQGPGLGSAFTVRLPLARQKEVPVPSQVPEEIGRIEKHEGAHHRVLVVDDNRDAADMLAEVLGSVGHTVRVAFDGLEAVSVASDFGPEIALVDIGLPVLDGFEVARRIHQDPKLRDVELVAVTGYGQSGDRERCMKAGFAEHLVKPVDMSRLLDIVSHLAEAGSRRLLVA